MQLTGEEANRIASLQGIKSVTRDQVAKVQSTTADSTVALDSLGDSLGQIGSGLGQVVQATAGGVQDVLQTTTNTLTGSSSTAQAVSSQSGQASTQSSAQSENQDKQAQESQWTGGFAWIKAPAVWQGVDSMPGTMGEGMVIGIIGDGINPEVRAFAATGDDGYTVKNPRGHYYGVCDPNSAVYDASFHCNSKLIGAWGAQDIDQGSPVSVSGNATKAASVAVGNIIHGAKMKSGSVTITQDTAGVAPHANLISYRVCDDDGCSISAVLSAIDQAVRDGVDVLIPSFGTSNDVEADGWLEPMSVSLLSAVDAGIFVSVGTENYGPSYRSVYPVSNALWVTSSADAWSNLVYGNKLTQMQGGDTAPPDNIISTEITAGYGPAKIVDAAKLGNPTCAKDKFNQSIKGMIVACQYDPDTYSELDDAVFAQGAGGIIFMSTKDFGTAGPGYQAVFSYDHPALFLTDDDSQKFQQWLDKGTGHTGKISGTQPLIESDWADVLDYSSSRAPTVVYNFIKPDITAPGTGILAAGPDNQYTVNSGTFLASAHIAGAAALLKALHPDWSPMEIQSAMMTTAVFKGIKKPDGKKSAEPFEMGAGRIDVSRAAAAGLVLDETAQHFKAANPLQGGDPATLNLSTLSRDSCVGQCTWQRTVTNTRSVPTAWEVMQNSYVTVTPDTFTLNPGESQTLTVKADLSDLGVDDWLQTQVQFKSLTNGVPDAHFTLVAYNDPSNFNAPGRRRVVAVSTTKQTGQFTVKDLQAQQEITDMQVHVYGLAKASLVKTGQIKLPDDDDNLSEFNTYLLSVPQNAKRLVAEITETDAKSLNLLIGHGTQVDRNGLNDYDYGYTRDYLPDAYLNIPLSEDNRDLWIAVKAKTDLNPEVVHYKLHIAYLNAVTGSDKDNLKVEVPNSVPAGQPFNATVTYNLPDAKSGERYYGAFTLGADSGSDELGVKYINLNRE
jgi:hypothetical protein